MALPNQSSLRKISYIESLRGLASLQVLALHILSAYYASIFNFRENLAKGEGLISTALSFLYDGKSAVFIFFILSAIVLRSSFERYVDFPIALLASRFLRLFIPAAFACIFAYAVIAIVGTPNRQVGELVASTWFASQWQGPPTVWFLLREILFNSILIGYSGGGSLFDRIDFIPLVHLNESYVAPLWSLNVEFQGSILILLLCWIGKLPRFTKMIAYSGLIFVLLKTYFVCFIFGFFLAPYVIDRHHILNTSVAYLFCTLGVIICMLGSTNQYDYVSLVCDRYALTMMSCTPFQQKALGSILFTFGIFQLPLVLNLLSRPFFVSIGKISFPVYLFHWPILFGVSASFFLISYPSLGYDLAKFCAAALAGIITIMIASLFAPLDEKVRQWARDLRAYLIYRSKLNGTKST